MGVSFKISKTGRRFRPKHPPQAPVSIAEDGDNPDDVVSDGIPKKLQDGIAKAENLTGLLSNTRAREHVSPDQEASFVVVLLPDGFFVEKPSEVIKLQNILQDRPTSRLLPYNRDSENLFSAIESGWVPGELLDDIPCKYFNGALVCEVRDYRKCMPEQGAKISSMDDVPIINKVLLRMSLENIVKDMPSISDDSWTYGDRMEVESRVLKALQPKLCLDPTPMLDRVCSNTVSDKLNLGICGFKRRRLKTDFSVECNNQAHGKKACTDRVPENANYESANLRTISGDATMQRPHEATLRSKGFLQEASIPTVPSTSQSHYQAPGSHPRVNRDSLSVSAASLPGIATQNQLQNTISSYTDLVGGNMHGKRDAQEMQFANIPGTKRSKQTAVTQDTNQHLPGLRTEGPTGGDMQWKSAMLREQLDPKGIHYSMAINSQRAPIMNDIPNMEGGGSFYSNQQGIRFGIKQEQTENEKLDRQESDRFKPVLKVAETDTSQLNAQQLRQHQLSQQAFIRSQFTHQQWNNLSSPSDNGRKDEMPSKNSKKSQSPRISAGTMVQSPVSSKSGDISAVSFLGSHKEKTPAISSAAVGTPSVTSSPSDSMQRNSQGPAKGKKGSIPKAPSMSGVGSPASVGNVSAAPLSANSPSVVTAPMGIADSYILERLSKIEMISQRYQLNNKKNKVENFNSVKQTAFSSQEVSYYLSNSMNAEDLTDPARPMSKSIMGGTMNNCKTRILNCVRSSVYQGNNTVGPARIRNRLIMTERPADGTVVMQYGDMDETDVPSTQDCLLTLPTTLYADLLAAQFVELMKHDGFDMIDDQIRPIAPRMSLACSNPLSAGMPPDSVVPEGQHVDGNSSQHPNAAAQVNSNSSMGNLNSNQNTSNSTRMMPPGNVSQGYLPSGQNLALPARTQQMEQTILQHQQSQQQQQQMQSQLQQQQPQLQNQPSQIQQQQPQPHQQLQHPQIHRSGINPLSHLIGHNSNLQMSGNQMVNKPTQLQLQALQQGQLRKSMIGLGAPMNLGNNMMGGLGGLSNVIMRGISSPVPPIQNLTNITQNQMNLAAANFGVGFRPGSLPNAQATALAKMRMATQAQNRGNLFAGQSGMAGLPGNSNQMLPSSMGLSMLGQTLNRPNVNQLQRASVASMGPPKIPGTNIYMNPQQLQMQQQQIQQQQQQQQHLHHHQQQMPQQEQQQQQQQQISSPLQQSQVSSPSIVGSPPGMPMQQLQISPQQMSQQTAISPQQLSAGALQQMNTASTAGPGPASPQLSSQTHGSVGSISSSPMDHLHGANKGSSVNTG